MTHTEGILTLLDLYKNTYIVGTLNDLKPLSQRTVSKRLPIPELNEMIKPLLGYRFRVINYAYQSFYLHLWIVQSCRPITQWRSQPRNLGEAKIWGNKMFDFRRITLFSLEKRLSKHKMNVFSKHLVGHGPFRLPLATPMLLPAWSRWVISFLIVPCRYI